MARDLFVDSSGWIALFDRSDQYHEAARRGFFSLQDKPIQLLTSDYVFDETVTHLRCTTGHEVASRFGQWVLNAPQVQLVAIDYQLWLASWEMFQGYKDRVWSFTDCTSFILMQQYHVWQAFAFDHDFVQAGFQLWPARG